MIETKILTQSRQLYSFVEECKFLGWSNNNSLYVMKWKHHTFWGTYIDNNLAAVSGLQKLPEISDTTYRILFRGAQLPKYNNYFKNISRYHFNSIGFYEHVTPQIEHAPPGSDFVITTNVTHDASGRMNRTHRVMQLLAKQGMVTLLKNDILYNTLQSIWTLNVDCYMEKRRNARMERNPLFICNS